MSLTYPIKLELDDNGTLLVTRLLMRENVTRAELMRRLNWKRESVDRLFRLNHATRLEQFDAAFRALGHRVEISVH